MTESMGLFARIGRLLLGHPPGSAAACMRLRAVVAARGEVELRPALGSGGGAEALRLPLLAASRTEFVVDGSHAAARGIGRFARFELLLTEGGDPVVGDVECLGRSRVPRPGGGTVPGYRFSLPETIRPLERRNDQRLSFVNGIAEAQLRVLGRQGPIQAMVEDVSERGARVRCRNGHGAVKEGGHAHFRSVFPAPIGTVDDMVRVLGVEMDKASGDMMLRLQFGRKIEALAKGGAKPGSKSVPNPRRASA